MACFGRSDAFASKPAPTFDRVHSLECSQMWEILCCRASLPSASESAPSSKCRHTANLLWERACPRRRRISRHKC